MDEMERKGAAQSGKYFGIWMLNISWVKFMESRYMMDTMQSATGIYVW